MRRADRLFAILQILRRGKVARAVDIAAALDVTPRTIYRDVSDLMAHGVPIDGAAGVGYILRPGYDLPPLMFDQPQLEALVLGARIVESWGDPELAMAAADVIAMVRAVVPPGSRRSLDEMTLWAPQNHYSRTIEVDGAARNGRPSAMSGRWRWPSSVRSGCWRRGASCAAISACSGSTACRA